MTDAINELMIAIETQETNLQVDEREGKTKDVLRRHERIASFRDAISALQAREG